MCSDMTCSVMIWGERTEDSGHQMTDDRWQMTDDRGHQMTEDRGQVREDTI